MSENMTGIIQSTIENRKLSLIAVCRSVGDARRLVFRYLREE